MKDNNVRDAEADVTFVECEEWYSFAMVVSSSRPFQFNRGLADIERGSRIAIALRRMTSK